MTKSEGAREYEDSFWMDVETSLVREELETKPIYDLEERTARFGEAVIDFAKKIPRDPVTDRIVSQLVALEQASEQTMSRLMIGSPNENS